MSRLTPEYAATRKGRPVTPNEFKTWFEGFAEAMEGTPNAEQWERIRERVAKIDSPAIVCGATLNAGACTDGVGKAPFETTLWLRRGVGIVDDRHVIMRVLDRPDAGVAAS